MLTRAVRNRRKQSVEEKRHGTENYEGRMTIDEENWQFENRGVSIVGEVDEEESELVSRLEDQHWHFPSGSKGKTKYYKRYINDFKKKRIEARNDAEEFESKLQERTNEYESLKMDLEENCKEGEKNIETWKQNTCLDLLVIVDGLLGKVRALKGIQSPSSSSSSSSHVDKSTTPNDPKMDTTHVGTSTEGRIDDLENLVTRHNELGTELQNSTQELASLQLEYQEKVQLCSQYSRELLELEEKYRRTISEIEVEFKIKMAENELENQNARDEILKLGITLESKEDKILEMEGKIEELNEQVQLQEEQIFKLLPEPTEVFESLKREHDGKYQELMEEIIKLHKEKMEEFRRIESQFEKKLLSEKHSQVQAGQETIVDPNMNYDTLLTKFEKLQGEKELAKTESQFRLALVSEDMDIQSQTSTSDKILEEFPRFWDTPDSVTNIDDKGETVTPVTPNPGPRRRGRPKGSVKRTNRDPNGRFRCEQCDKTYADLPALCQHRRIHCGVRYPCNICGKKYKRQPLLSKHKCKGKKKTEKKIKGKKP